MAGAVTVSLGNCVEALKARAALVAAGEAEPFDAGITDPPYHLTSIVKRFGADGAAPAKSGKTGAYARASAGFMGKKWDGGDVAFRPETWRAVFDNLKPGAHLVAFSGTRTFHRMVCAIEDAGFEIRDTIAWAYGSGFPKSHDVAKAIAARETTGGSSPQNLRRARMQDDYEPTGQADYRQGRAFSDDIADDDHPTPLTPDAEQWDGWGTALKPSIELICLARKPLSEKSVAANVLRWGTGALNIDGCRVEGTGNKTFERGPGYRSREQYRTGTTIGSAKETDVGRWPANLCHDGSDEVIAAFPENAGAFAPVMGTEPSGAIHHVFGDRERTATHHHGDSGSAARFFYSAKAGPLDRLGSSHPTVKPVDLMRWLCRLVCPPGGLIVDRIAGSGSTGIAAIAEGMRAELIDIEADHVADIERKLALLRGEGRHLMVELNEAKAKRAKPKKGEAGLFDQTMEAAE